MGIEVDFSEEGQQDFKPLEAKATETQQEVKAPIIEDQKSLHEIFKPLEGKDTKSENPVEKTAVELTEEQVTAYLKSKYQDRQFEKLDDLLKPQETKTRYKIQTNTINHILMMYCGVRRG